MVSFRLTLEDYRIFTQTCEHYRIRSVSELARTAMRLMASERNTTVDNRLQELQDQVRLLTANMERLSGKVGAVGAEQDSHA